MQSQIFFSTENHHAGFLVWFLFQIIHEVSSQTGFEARHCNLIIYNEKGLVYLNVNILPIWSELSTENRWQIKLRLPFMLELLACLPIPGKIRYQKRCFYIFRKQTCQQRLSVSEEYVRGIGHRRSRVYSLNSHSKHPSECFPIKKGQTSKRLEI